MNPDRARAGLVAVGWSLHLPGTPIGSAIAHHIGRPRQSWAWTEAEPSGAAAILGRKGLLYKEPATRLALCAVHRALGLPWGRRADHPLAARVAVVACGNLGNVETVARITRTIAAEGGRSVSVLDAPNASSNVVASTVALWFGFGGPNLMICSGSRAGHDGLRLAALLLRANRADRVVLVGAEPADEVATALRAGPGGVPAPTMLAGAACLILEANTGQPVSAGEALLEVVGPDQPWPRPPRVIVGAGGFEPARAWGDLYGAQAIADVALAAHLAIDEAHRVVGVPDPGADGVGAYLVSSADAVGAGRS